MSDGFAYAHVDRVRYGDLDAQRHLNNVAFLQFFESARIAWIRSRFGDGDLADGNGLGGIEDFGLIFAECRINYRSPAFYDEEIRTLVGPGELRRSSIQVLFEMRSGTDDRLLAEGYGVLVGYDYAAGRARRLPADFGARLIG